MLLTTGAKRGNGIRTCLRSHPLRSQYAESCIRGKEFVGCHSRNLAHQASHYTSSSSTPPLRKSSVPFRDYSAVRRNSRGISREDLALDSFLSRHRPLFLMDLRGDQQPHDYTQLSPWLQSASGAQLNPEMNNVPEEVVEKLRPFEEQKSELEAAQEEDEEINDLSEVAMAANNGGYVGDQPLFGVLPFDPFQQQQQKSTTKKEKKTKEVNFRVKDLNVTLPAGTSATISLVKKDKKAPGPMYEKYTITTQEGAKLSDSLKMSPTSGSFLRSNIYADSVKRKRRTKMNRHKYKKRRKAQRSLRRKLRK